MHSPETVLALVAAAIGQGEFERRGQPETLQPRHFGAAREALEAAASAIYDQDVGTVADLRNYGSRLLAEAADASGPDRPEAGDPS